MKPPEGNQKSARRLKTVKTEVDTEERPDVETERSDTRRMCLPNGRTHEVVRRKGKRPPEANQKRSNCRAEIERDEGGRDAENVVGRMECLGLLGSEDNKP